MSAPTWEVYEQYCGRWRVVDDYTHEPEDDDHPGPGWEPFAVLSITDHKEGTHAVFWRRQVLTPGPVSPVTHLKRVG